MCAYASEASHVWQRTICESMDREAASLRHASSRVWASRHSLGPAKYRADLCPYSPSKATTLAIGTPLVDTDQRSATLVFGGDKAQSLTHGHLAVGGGDDDARLSDSRTAGGGEHHVGRSQEDEGVDVLLVEGVAQVVEVGLRAQGLVDHHHAHEQTVLAGHGFDGGDGGNRAEEFEASGDQPMVRERREASARAELEGR